MIEVVLDILRDLGLWGLLIGIMIEALAIPFPASLFMLIYSYLLQPTLLELLGLVFMCSTVYVLFSFIPYWISFRYEHLIEKKLTQRKFKWAEHWFTKYGEWMIAFGRMFGMGYISYIAGISKIRPWKYGLFTLIGFLPISLVVFILGSLGNIFEIAQALQNSQLFLGLAFVLAIMLYIGIRLLRRKGSFLGNDDYT